MTDIPYNIDFTFDNNLREIPENPEDMIRAIDYLETRLIEESQDDYERMRLSGMVGTLYLILGDDEMAEEHINTAIASSNNLRDRQAQLRNLMRLAQVYQFRKQFMLADRIFKQVIQAYEASRDASHPNRNSIFMTDLDMAYQQYGKCLFDQGDYEIALHMFEKALNIQQHKQGHFSIASTQHAIQVTTEKLAVRK
jgi:tetratricopeptide (TPR) repeat protein